MREPIQRTSSAVLRSVALALGWWIVLSIFWLLLVDTTAPAEIVAALVAAACTAVVLAAVAAHGMAHGAPRLRWFALLAWKLPARALEDSIRVLLTLWRRLVLHERTEGAFRVLRFDPGGVDSRSSARRALLVAALSLPPNSFVVAIDSDSGRLLLHQLAPSTQSRGGAGVEWPL